MPVLTANQLLHGLAWLQIRAPQKLLVNRQTREDHNAATGRRFTFRSPLAFLIQIVAQQCFLTHGISSLVGPL
jgi:hypothetical protein